MFTHLRVASSLSLQYGTTLPEDLVATAVSNGASACALTDRDGLYGAIRHIRSCISEKVAPIVGVELLVSFAKEIHTVTVLAHGKNAGAGWAALCRIISAAHSQRWQRGTPHSNEERRPVLPAQHLPSFLRDINDPECTVLLSPESNVGRALEQQKFAQAQQHLTSWRRLLGCAINVEVVCHYTEPGTLGSLRHAAKTVELAWECGIEAVLTNAVRLLTPRDVITADLLSSASQLKELDYAHSVKNAQAWLKPPEQMLALMAEIGSQPGVTHAALTQMLRRTEHLAELCQLDPHDDLGWRKAKLPEASVAGIFGDPVRILYERTQAGITLRYPSAQGSLHDALHRRMHQELETITRFGFSAYFLIVADVADIIRALGIRSQARGSGAGSLVNYALGISSVDPMEHDLLFERFLSSNRETLPDIDIDVESARRHEIYRAILSKYGSTRVTLLSMRTGYRARSAARDTGRALGINSDEIDSIAKHIWRFKARDFRAVLHEKPELRPVAERARTHESVDKLIDLVPRLDALPRHLAMHPCGVILSNSNLLSTTPVQPSGIGIAMSQFDKDDIDDIGFLKLDILGVRMQSAMAHAVSEIRRVRGSQARKMLPSTEHPRVVDESGLLNLDHIKLDDAKTFETIRTTNTIGMFQIESPGQRELIGKLQPHEFEDLIAEISLFRPGPMKGNMIAPFIDARQGVAAPKYIHPRFVSILAPTYGVIIYHEQVIRIFSDCMGITLSQADEYRRAMGSPSRDLEAEFRYRTANRRDSITQNRLFSDSEIDRIWDALRGFGSFGFCKAHGAAFALPTYQTAWLKTHFTVEFFAGLLTHDPGMYPKRLLLNEVKRLGIPILPLCVNASRREYRVEPVSDQLGIRLALSDIRNITTAEIERIENGQPFTSSEDFVARARPSQRLLTSLERLGALTSFARPYTEVSGPQSVLTQKPDHSAEQHSYEVIREKMRTEVELLGLDVSAHVLDPYREILNNLDVFAADELLHLPNTTDVLVAGVRVATQTPGTRSGKRVVFVTLDDGTGCSDVTFFGEAQDRAGPALFTSSLLLVAGKTRRTGARGVSVLAENAWPLSEIARHYQRRIHTATMREG